MPTFPAMFNEDVLDGMYILDCQSMEFFWALSPVLLMHFLLKIALYIPVFFLDLCLSAEFLGHTMHRFLVLLYDLYYSEYHLLSKVITPLNSL